MRSTNAAAHNFIPPAAQVFNQQHRNYGGQRNGGCTRECSQGGRGRLSRWIIFLGVLPYLGSGCIG